MLIDAFTFLNEFELLQLRLSELADYVDWFVLIESEYTLSGRKKPLYFNENPIHGYKIKHIIVEPLFKDFYDMPILNNQQDLALANERNQRNEGFFMGTQDCDATDLVLCSDVDEIPRASKLLEGPHNSPAVFEMQWFNYWLNCECVDPLINPCRGTARGPVEYVQRFDGGHSLLMSRATPQSVHLIHDGGWHFSFLGGAERIQEKLQSFAHAPVSGPEFTNLEWIQSCMDNGGDVMKGHYGNRRYRFVDIDDTWPHTITDNLGDWSHLIKQ